MQHMVQKTTVENNDLIDAVTYNKGYSGDHPVALIVFYKKLCESYIYS